MNPDQDGKDHINLYSKAKTEFGRYLSNWSSTAGIAFENGKFKSLEGMWFYLKREDERFRACNGWQAKKLAKELGVDGMFPAEKLPLFVDGMSAKVAARIVDISIWNKDRLPFEHYYVYGNKLVNAGFGWWVEAMHYLVNYWHDRWLELEPKLKEHQLFPWYNMQYWRAPGSGDYDGRHPLEWAAMYKLLSRSDFLLPTHVALEIARKEIK